MNTSELRLLFWEKLTEVANSLDVAMDAVGILDVSVMKNDYGRAREALAVAWGRAKRVVSALEYLQDVLSTERKIGALAEVAHEKALD